METKTRKTRWDAIADAIREIDTDTLVAPLDENITEVNITKQQKIYQWVRVFLKEETSDTKIGDVLELVWTPTGESMKLEFNTYGKKGLEIDKIGEIAAYEKEDDKKVLILMVDQEIMLSEETPFIRTMFVNSPYYQFNVWRRSDLRLQNSAGVNIEYIDINF